MNRCQVDLTLQLCKEIISAHWRNAVAGDPRAAEIIRKATAAKTRILGLSTEETK